MTLTAEKSGTHYVEVYGNTGASADYSLELSGSSLPSGNNDTNEDNESDRLDPGTIFVSGDNENNGDDESDGGGSDGSADGSGPGSGLVSALTGLWGAGYLLRRVGSARRE